jgi:hypothetical protein
MKEQNRWKLKITSEGRDRRIEASLRACFGR